MLCYAMLCYAMLCYATPCHAVLCYVMLRHAMLCFAVLCCAMLCYAMLCHANAMLLSSHVSEVMRTHTGAKWKLEVVQHNASYLPSTLAKPRTARYPPGAAPSSLNPW